MDLAIVLLRIVHIVASVLWVGAAALLYVDGTRNALGSADETLDVPIYFGITSTISVVGGAILYWIDSHGLQVGWVTSPRGLAFGLGGLAALAVWIIGNIVIPRIIAQRMAISHQGRSEGAHAGPETVSHLHAIQSRLGVVSQLEIALLVVAVVAMAIAPELT